MKARELIEKMCREGDTVWQNNMLSLRASSVLLILEAWTNERKAQIVRQNSEKGIALVDHVVLDDYDLILWKVPVNVEFNPTGFLYAVSINSEQHDPSDERTQRLKFPGSSLRHLPVSSVNQVLRGWIEDHGKLAIGTVEMRKLQVYRRLLAKHFKVTDMDSNPASGFYLE